MTLTSDLPEWDHHVAGMDTTDYSTRVPEQRAGADPASPPNRTSRTRVFSLEMRSSFHWRHDHRNYLLTGADYKKKQNQSAYFPGSEKVPTLRAPTRGMLFSMWKAELLNHGQLGLLCVWGWGTEWEVGRCCLVDIVNSISQSRLTRRVPDQPYGRSLDLG